MDAALRANLSEGLADGLDKAIIAGTNGLFTGTNLANNAVTVNDTFDSYLSHTCAGTKSTGAMLPWRATYPW